MAIKVNVKKSGKKTTTIQVGNTTVKKLDLATAQNEDIARYLFPEVSELIDELMRPIYQEARAKWPRPGKAHPRSTGRSFAAMTYTGPTINSKGLLKGVIFNYAVNPKDRTGYPYAYAIRTANVKGKTIWSQYLTKPFRKQKKNMMSELVEAYRKVLERSNG